VTVLAKIGDFLQDERGAVTVDWVVLTAAVVGIGLVVLGPIAFNTGNSMAIVAASISSVTSAYMPD